MDAGSRDVVLVPRREELVLVVLVEADVEEVRVDRVPEVLEEVVPHVDVVREVVGFQRAKTPVALRIISLCRKRIFRGPVLDDISSNGES